MDHCNAGCNTDKELWRKVKDDYYSPSIHVTQNNGIGIRVGGLVIVAPVERWYKAGELLFCINPKLKRWKWKLVLFLLGLKEKKEYRKV